MTALARIFHGKADAAAGMRERREIDRVKVNAIFGIAEKNHLLPFNLPERVVLDYDDFDRQFVFDGRYEVGHEHGKATITHESDALPIGEGDLRRDAVRQSRSHGGKIARQSMHLPAAGENLSSPPRRDRAAIAAHDG